MSFSPFPLVSLVCHFDSGDVGTLEDPIAPWGPVTALVKENRDEGMRVHVCSAGKGRAPRADMPASAVGGKSIQTPL